MELSPAGDMAILDCYIGNYQPYVTSHAAPDEDVAISAETRNAALALAQSVQRYRAGQPRRVPRWPILDQSSIRASRTCPSRNLSRRSLFESQSRSDDWALLSMPDLYDFFLLRRPPPRDDRSLAFRRIDGNPHSRVIYFLPFNTPFRVARYAGFVPLDFLACYEMPSAIVSSDPRLSVEAMLSLVADAERLCRKRNLVGWVIVGLSAGTVPATYLANCNGGRLCSVASVDRADVAVWHSPATRWVKSRASQRNIDFSHYFDALKGCHPSENLAGIGANSVFVIGRRDCFIPPRCIAGLLHAIERFAVRPHIIEVDAGHFKTLRASAKYQRVMLGIRQPAVDLRSLASTCGAATIGQVDTSRHSFCTPCPAEFS